MNNKKIIQMTVCRERAVDTLLDKIKFAIEEGFQPYGEVFKDEDKWFSLLMVKYEQ